MVSHKKLEKMIREALRRQNHGAAAELIEQALAQPRAAEEFFVPELLGELADCYEQLNRYNEAIAAMERAIEAGWEGNPDGRVRIAYFLLRSGREEEAAAMYARVKADTPDDVWLHNAAGMDYMDVGDYGRAWEWLTAGLELALGQDDPEDLVDQMAELRQECLDKLGHPADALQARAAEFSRLARTDHEEDTVAAQDTWEEAEDDPFGEPVPPAPVRAVFGWFPAEEFPTALARWPALADSWGTNRYQQYCQLVQAAMLRLQVAGAPPPFLAPIRVAAYEKWCAVQERDSGAAQTRAAYAADRARQGVTAPWPPGRNDPCWCGSGKKYKKCCGTVDLRDAVQSGAADLAETESGPV